MIKDKVVTVESLSALHEHNKNAYVAKTDVVSIENGGTGATTAELAVRNIGAEPAIGVLPIRKGGTGVQNGKDALKGFFADGATILSSYQYGDTLPAAGTAGRIFFKKLSE